LPAAKAGVEVGPSIIATNITGSILRYGIANFLPV